MEIENTIVFPLLLVSSKNILLNAVFIFFNLLMQKFAFDFYAKKY